MPDERLHPEGERGLCEGENPGLVGNIDHDEELGITVPLLGNIVVVKCEPDSCMDGLCHLQSYRKICSNRHIEAGAIVRLGVVGGALGVGHGEILTDTRLACQHLLHCEILV